MSKVNSQQKIRRLAIFAMTLSMISLVKAAEVIEVSTGESISIVGLNTNCATDERIVLNVENGEDGKNREVKTITSSCEPRKCYVNFSSNVKFDYPYVGRWYDVYIELGSQYQLRKLTREVVAKNEALSKADELVSNKICHSYTVSGALDLTGPEKRFTQAIYQEGNDLGININ